MNRSHPIVRSRNRAHKKVTLALGGLLLFLSSLPFPTARAAEADDPAATKKALDSVVEKLNALDR